MLTTANMIPALLAASPAFAGEWEALRRDWPDESPQLYVVLAEFSRHVIGLLAARDEDRLRRVFDVIETFHVDGAYAAR